MSINIVKPYSWKTIFETDLHNVFSEKGLSNYKNVTVLKPLLTECLKEAEQKLPEDVSKSTPLFMKATAGMRKLK